VGLDGSGRDRGRPVIGAVRQLVETALRPWGGSAAVIDAYEAAVRSAAEAQVTLARATDLQPVRSIVVVCADLTRDLGAV
jgi:hypothetical protein